MTTVSVTSTYAKISADAGGAARQLRERLKEVAAGSNDDTASYDMAALAKVLETAAAAAAPMLQGGRGYILSWSTSGSNDAITKTVALRWLYDSRRMPLFGLEYGGHSLTPRLGDDLLTLINQL